MATLLDTNVVLRYLLEDLQDQADAAADAIASGAEVRPEIISECVYVLSGPYEVPRELIAEGLSLVLDEVACPRRSVVLAALGLYKASKLDFPDCLLAAEHDVESIDVLTFDKGLNKLMHRMDGAR